MAEEPYTLDHEWETLRTTFEEFHTARDLDGLWKRITHAELPPVIHPKLKKYAEGVRYMSGKLREDFRILKVLHSSNPTLIDAQVRGATQAARNLERDFKLTWASWWDRKLNRGRGLDSEVYEAQIGIGAWVGWLRWKMCMNEDGTSDCPVYIHKTLLDTMVWQGDFQDPSVAICRYSVSMLDCDIKNKKGERPYYANGEVIGWTSEMLSRDDYKNNAGKKIDIIVRDAIDPLAMCPLPGCHHPKRRITISVCKPGDQADKYEEVETYDSPFSKCSFVIVGGDVNRTERDPHEILRPSAWILIQLVLEYNNLYNSLYAAFAREMADERLYENMQGATPDLISAVHGDEDSGQSDTTKIPELGPDEMHRTAGPVSMFPKPSTAELMALMDKVEREYERYRPNDALTGRMAVSEVAATSAVMQKQGAGLMMSEDLVNWDDGHDRFFEETMHGICFTSYFLPDEEQVRFVATVSGRENVKGSRAGAKPGDVVYLDATKAATPVSFRAETSSDTPADRRDREERARTAKAAGIFVQRDVDEAYGIFDPEMQERERFRELVRDFLQPIKLRRVAARVAKQSAVNTGVDMGEEGMVDQLPMPGDDAPQTYNTAEANAARRHAPPVEIPSTTNPNLGGASGLV